MIRRATVASLLERLLARRDEPDGVEPQGIACYLCDDEMSVVNGVEGSTEEAYHQALTPRKGAPGRPLSLL